MKAMDPSRGAALALGGGGARGLAVAVAVTAAILVGYAQIPHGEPRTDAAYRSVRAAVVDL